MKDRILRRRAKLIAAAFASAAAAAQCGGTAQPCLKMAVDSGIEDAGEDVRDAASDKPQACLTPQIDP